VATSEKNLSEYNKETIPNGADFRIGIVVSEWNQSITSNLCKGALAVLLDNGVKEKNIVVYECPGSIELPLASQYLLENGKIAIGRVIFD
jgi:6,7-dimethyl-8-ribityllumazine synthase